MSEISLQPLVETAINVVMDSNNLNLSYKVNDQRENNFSSSEERVDNNTIQCYVNQDNTLSFINNSNVFQTVEDDCGEIYYACIGANDNDINHQDQVLQLIPQNQISNYIISDKDYSNVTYVNESVINGTNYYDSQNTTYNQNKYQYDNLDPTVYKTINGTGKQTCEICEVEFPSKRTYLKHMSIHENDREFKCSWCKLSYNYEVNLLVHIAIIHTNECTVVNDSNQEMNYKCVICSCLFSRKKAHQAHCLIHQVDEELPCEHCPALFKCKVLLDKHLNDHKIGEECDDRKLTTNYLKCKICHDIFENVGNVKKHYVRCHPKTSGHWPIEDGMPVKPVERVPTPIEEEEKSNKRKSSKIACQTIKLYAQGRSQLDEMKPDVNRSISKRGRPKKTDNKSTKSNSNCAVCGKEFKTPILLRRHEVTHTGIKEFECPICKKGFTQKSSVKIHMVVHDNVKGFLCQFCGKAFTYEHNMNTHIKVIHKNGTEVLSQSQEHLLNESNDDEEDQKDPNRFKKIASLAETNQSPTDDAEITQYLWNENPTNENHFSYQPNHQSNTDSYIPSAENFIKLDWDKSHQGILLSEDVERIDKETGQIQLHEMIKDQVTGFRRFRCRFCYKLYRKSCDLTRHIRIHTQQKPFQCYMCHKSFRLKSVLKNHFKSHWKLKEFSCEICNKIFNLKQTLKVHRQLHEPDKLRFVCKICDRRFNTGFHLRYHYSTSHHRSIANPDPSPHQSLHLEHQSLQQHESLKNKPTANSNNPPDVKPLIWNELLNQPIPIAEIDKRKLSNNRLFKCNHCGKSYKFKKYLNEHLKEHLSANNTNVCQFCNKSFVTYRSMQQHLRTQHLNRRKFSCLQCPAFFITKASLIRHGLVHSNSKPYACPLCLRRFKAKIYCDRHISAKKCSKKKRNRFQQNDLMTGIINRNPIGSLANQIGQSDLEANDQSETFTAFRLEDLDMNSAQSSNILVTNYVNEFSSFPSTEKYMIVSLDNPNSKDQSGSSQQNYYASNILLDDSSLLDLARNQIESQTDQSENIMSLLDNGQMGVTPVDIGSLFAVQGFNGNIATQLVDHGNIQSNDIDYSQPQENIYYYQALNEIPTVECPIECPSKSSLADKFPILKASLFSDDELTSNHKESNPFTNSSMVTNSNGSQFIITSSASVTASSSTASAILQSHPEISPIKFYHGCANCDHQFKDSQSLVEHVKSQHKIRRDFTCNVCHKAFSAKLSLWAHSKTHIDSRSFGCFVCIACNQRFISVPSLSRHVRMQHNDNLNLYRCTHCNKVYKTTRELDSHVKQLVSDYDALIINSNQFVENNNQNTVTNDNNNNNNNINFTKIKSDIDIDIDRVYFPNLHNSQIVTELETVTNSNTSGNTSKLSLKELLSTKESILSTKSTKTPDFNKTPAIDCLLSFPYSCSICHKGFNRASNLQQHLSVHTKLRPYQCPKCPKRFRHRCSLKTHEATKHSSVTKLLRCHLCLKLLRSQVALRNHLKLHVREYSVHCKVCYKGFDLQEDLSRHVDEKHAASSSCIEGLPEGRKPAGELSSSITHHHHYHHQQQQKPIKEVIPEIPKKLIKCLSCSFIFNTKAKYDNHFCVGLKAEKSHLNRCCDKTFESTSQFLYHVQEVHNQLIQYNCAQCNIMFAQESSYVNHQKSVHHL